jgi:dTDP-4-amino-4,6-dideoxygalactose transaminase
VLSAFDGPGFSGKAQVVADYEATIAHYFDVAHVLAASNGTVAIELALRGLKLGTGDRIALPPTAPIMSVLPILAIGAEPVFYDVASDHFGPDLDDLAALIAEPGQGLQAVMTVPMWGYPWDVAPVAQMCKAAGIPLIEDCAHAFGTAMDGRKFGTFGDAAAFSTHERKLVSTGEGGFCLTPHSDVHARMRQFQHHGARTGKDGIERPGEGLGSNAKLAPLCAALGISQFAKLDAKIAARRSRVIALRHAMEGLDTLVEMRRHPAAEINGYATVWWHTGHDTRVLTHEMSAKGIQSDTTRYGYKPLYEEPAFQAFARPCPNAERMISSILTLPSHEGLMSDDIAFIAETAADVFKRSGCSKVAQ